MVLPYFYAKVLNSKFPCPSKWDLKTILRRFVKSFRTALYKNNANLDVLSSLSSLASNVLTVS